MTHLGDDITEPTTPEYQPASQPNQCLREECAELTLEVAKQLIEQMDNLIASPSSTSTSLLAPNGGFGTQVQPPIVTANPTRSPIPNWNVAKTMTLAQEELALFDDEEQDMYFHDRMCFYANVERQYASVATASPSMSSEPHSNSAFQLTWPAAPTRLARRDNVISYIQQGYGASATATPLASSDVSYYQSALWNTWMPNYILSIYAPATANGSMTTATTTCSGLGGASSITMSYVQARVSSHSPTPTLANSNMVEGAANVPVHAGGSAMFGAVVALVGLIVL